MQRVRMSLPYFRKYGWEPEVVTVAPEYSEMPKDDLLLNSIPSDIRIHQVAALNKRWSSKLGLGSLGLRAFQSYYKKVNKLLEQSHFDLLYFSTTQFPVCALGAMWKKRFNVPYVIDMQDPWYTGSYYHDKPHNERPSKYRLIYPLHKYLERIAMNRVGGLLSVSADYLSDLIQQYPRLKNVPSAVITFGASHIDSEIAEENQQKFKSLLDSETVNIVYIGRGGIDMHEAVSALFKAVKLGLNTEHTTFRRLRLYFIGTSYAPAGHGSPTISPLAEHYGISDNIVEITDRISYYHALATLQQANALFIPGSSDQKYTASKIYPYLLTGRPLLAMFHPKSPALQTLIDYGVKHAFDYTCNPTDQILNFLKDVMGGSAKPESYNDALQRKYSAENMTRLQCALFEHIISKNETADTNA